MNQNYLPQRSAGGDAVYEAQNGTPSYTYVPIYQADNTLSALVLVSWGASFSYTLPDTYLTAVGAQEAVSAVNASVNVTQDDNTLQSLATVAYVGTRYTVLHLTAGLGTINAPASFSFAFFDQATPQQLDAPTVRGTGTSDSNGSVTLQLSGSQLPPGGIGYIVMSDTSGNPDVPWKEHSGPVRVF